jgi:hypothetical protein
MSKAFSYKLRDLTTSVSKGETGFIDHHHFTTQGDPGSAEMLEANLQKGFVAALAKGDISFPRNTTEEEIFKHNKYQAEMDNEHRATIKREPAARAPIVPTNAAGDAATANVARDPNNPFRSYRAEDTPMAVTAGLRGDSSRLRSGAWSPEARSANQVDRGDKVSASHAASESARAITTAVEARCADLRLEIEAADQGIRSYEEDLQKVGEARDQLRGQIDACEAELKTARGIARAGYDTYEAQAPTRRRSPTTPTS